MRLTLRNALFVCTAFAVLGSVAVPDSAQAQFGIPGIGNVRIPNINMHRGNTKQYGNRSSRRSRNAESDGSSSSRSTPSNRERDAALAAIAPASREQSAILRNAVTASVVIGVVGAKAQAEVGRTFSSEEDRDYIAWIEKILKEFSAPQGRSNDRNNTSRSDVTAHAIEQSLERAFKDASLERFESFLGENWSAERLRVLVLRRVQADLRRMLDANNRVTIPMTELDVLIQRSAKAVYRRVFELSELLAANRSSALFVQRLYQTHGGLVDDQLREVADRMITKASNSAIGRFEAALRRDDNGFTLRYRAQRIVLDCLSDNVERISSSETGIATIGEIEQRIADTANMTCAQWLVSEYGKEGDKLADQKPMPLRVIWSASGPKDDPSMYGRAAGAL